MKVWLEIEGIFWEFVCKLNFGIVDFANLFLIKNTLLLKVILIK